MQRSLGPGLLAVAAAASLGGRLAREGSGARKLELDLETLRLGSNNKAEEPVLALMKTEVHGEDFWCLNCKESSMGLFESFAEQLSCGSASNYTGGTDGASWQRHSKHPNSPEYQRWKDKQQRTLFLQRNEQSCKESVHVEHAEVRGPAVENMLPQLRTMYLKRQLVIGGVEPWKPEMEFIEWLVSMAKRATQLDFGSCGNVDCATLWSSGHSSPGVDFQAALEEAFGLDFLRKHMKDAKASEEEQRSHVQAVLDELKRKYSFYKGRCLTHEAANAACNVEADGTTWLGSMACDPEDGTDSKACAYAEIRQCEDCGAAGKRFFAYERLSDPIELLNTSNTRRGVMGQCEEFGRTATAVLSGLGYPSRYVFDFTDHAWTEVQLGGKWIHADPSEGVLDQPLMYEKGWGKKLTMIFALTRDKVEHVTAKYTEDYEATVERRGADEESLQAAVAEVNRQLQSPALTFQASARKMLNFMAGSLSLEEVMLWTRLASDWPSIGALHAAPR